MRMVWYSISYGNLKGMIVCICGKESFMMNSNAMSKEISRKFSFFMLGFILIVVLFHSDFRYYYPFIEQLTAVSTSYFFCVSAFFFYKGLSNENIATRLKKRCSTLLLPYLIWNLIYMLLFWDINNLSFFNVMKGFTVSPRCTPSWYLLTLFLFLIPAPLIKRAFCKVYSTIILLSLGIVISYLGYIRFQQELAVIPVVGGYLIRMAEYLTPYLIGGIIGTWFHQKIYVSWKKCMVGIISSCAIIILLLSNIPTEMRWLLWVILPLTLWESIPEKIFSYIGFLHFLTEAAFLINMMHCYFLFVWQSITRKNGLVAGKALSALNVIFTLLASYVLYYLLQLFMPKVLRILTGNRIRKLQS